MKKRFSPGRIAAAPFFTEALLLAATLSWGFSFIWVKQITLSGMDTNVFITIRYGLAALLMLPFCVSELRAITRRQALWGIAVGILMYLAMAAQTYGLMYTTPANSGFITTAYVVFVPFTSWLVLKKKPRVGLCIPALICVAGLYILNLGAGESLEMNAGNLITLLCAIFWSIQVPLVSRAGRECGVKTLTLVPVAVVFAMSAVLGALTGGFNLENVDYSAAMLPILLCALFPTLLAGAAQAYAQRHIDPSKAALIYTLESVFACIISVAMGLERLSVWLLAGGGTIISAIILSEYIERRAPKGESEHG